MLKVLVEDASDLIDPPSTLFCSLEYQGVKLATKHAVVRDQGYAKFHEEAEFNITKSGNLRVKLCTLNDKTSILPQKVSLRKLIKCCRLAAACKLQPYLLTYII